MVSVGQHNPKLIFNIFGKWCWLTLIGARCGSVAKNEQFLENVSLTWIRQTIFKYNPKSKIKTVDHDHEDHGDDDDLSIRRINDRLLRLQDFCWGDNFLIDNLWTLFHILSPTPRIIIVLITILNQTSIYKQQDTPRSWSTVENAQILFWKEMSGKPLKLSVGNCSQLRPPVNLHLERKLFYSIVLKHKSPQMFGNVNIQIKRVLSSNNVNNVLLFS